MFKLSFLDICEYKGEIYLFDNINKALFEYKTVEEEFALISCYEEDDFCAYHIFGYNDKIYISSYNSCTFLIFNLNKKRFERKTDFGEVNCDEYDIFDYHLFYKGIIWCFPNKLNGRICCYNIINNMITRVASFGDQIKNLTNNAITSFSSDYGGYYYATVYNTNKYIEYNLDTGIVVCHELDVKVKLAGILKVDDYIWFTEADRDRVIVCHNDVAVKEIRLSKNDQENIYSRMYVSNGIIILLPFNGDQIVLIDKYSCAIRKIELKKVFSEQILNKARKGASKLLKVLEVDDGIIICGSGLDAGLVCDNDLSTIKQVKFVVKEKDRSVLADRKLKSPFFERETEEFNIDNYVKLLCSK